MQCLAWHSDQRLLLSCARGIQLSDSETGERLKEFPGHTDTVRSVVWSQDERHILSASHDRSMRIWDSETTACLQVLEGHEACIVNVVWALDGISVLSCDSNGGLGRIFQEK